VAKPAARAERGLRASAADLRALLNKAYNREKARVNKAGKHSKNRTAKRGGQAFAGFDNLRCVKYHIYKQNGEAG